MARDDKQAFSLCSNRYINEVLELAFSWNEQFIPFFKWRVTHFRCLPICPATIREGVEQLSKTITPEASIDIAITISQSIKMLMKDLYHLDTELNKPLSLFSHSMRDSIEDEKVKEYASLDW